MQRYTPFLLCLLLTPLLYAEDLKTELGEKIFKANINTLLIFTSQDGLNTGTYNFKHIGTNMDVMHLPFLYHFDSDTRYNWFILGNVGYSRVYMHERRSEGVLDLKEHVKTYTAGLGGGIRYKYNKELSFLGGVEFIYSRAGISVQPKDSLGGAIEDFFNANYNDNLTYKFMARAAYEKLYKGYRPYLSVDFDTYDTKSSFTFKSLRNIDSQSSVLTLSSGVESPSLQNFGKNYMTFEGYWHYSYLFGSIEDIVKFNDFGTLGGVLYYYTPASPAFASRFFLEVSSVFSGGIEGYNVGVGFTMDF